MQQSQRRNRADSLILARVFGDSPDFRLNVERRDDLWEALDSPNERQRIERAKTLRRYVRFSP